MANQSPKISVIVPVYNAEQYIQKCIDSIIAQTFTNMELILINDGSKDNSGKICDEYAKIDNRIRVFHKENGGVSSARNVGLDHAKGEWIIFVDSDDWIEPNCFNILLSDTEIADLTYFGCRLYYDDKSVTSYIPSCFYSSNRDDIENKLWKLKINKQNFEYLGFTWNKLFRKSIIKKHKIEFLENLKFREDELFTLSYARYIKSLRIKPDTLYNYRVLGTGLTHSIKSKEEYLLLIEQLTEVLNQYRNNQIISTEENSILVYYFRALNAEKIFSKTGFVLFYNFLKKGRYLKKHKSIKDRKMNLIFRFNNILYQIITTISTIIIYK